VGVRDRDAIMHRAVRSRSVRICSSDAQFKFARQIRGVAQARTARGVRWRATERVACVQH